MVWRNLLATAQIMSSVALTGAVAAPSNLHWPNGNPVARDSSLLGQLNEKRLTKLSIESVYRNSPSFEVFRAQTVG